MGETKRPKIEAFHPEKKPGEIEKLMESIPQMRSNVTEPTTNYIEKYRKILHDKENDIDFLIESFIISFTEAMCLRMQELQMNNQDMANKLNLTASKIKKILKGDRGMFTLENMMKIGKILDIAVFEF